MNQLLLLLVLVVAGVLGTSVVRQLRSGQRAAAHHHRALDTLGHISSGRTRNPQPQVEGETSGNHVASSPEETAGVHSNGDAAADQAVHAHVRVVAADAPRRSTGPQVVFSASRFARPPSHVAAPEAGASDASRGADRRPTAELPAVDPGRAPAPAPASRPGPARSDPTPTPPAPLPPAETLVRIVDDAPAPMDDVAPLPPPPTPPRHRHRQHRPGRRQPARPARGTVGRRPVLIGAVVAAIVVVGVVGGVVAASRGSSKPSAPRAVAPSTTPVRTSPPTTAATTTAPPPTTPPPLTPTSTASGQATYQVGATASVTVTASSPAWVEIRTGGPSGAISFQGVLTAGQSKTLAVPTWLRIGKPAATSLTVSGQAVSLPPGAAAQPINLSFA